MSTTPKCPRCKSTSLRLVEITEEYHVWDDGLRVEGGYIKPQGECVNKAGDVIRSDLVCRDCGHVWACRWRVMEDV